MSFARFSSYRDRVAAQRAVSYVAPTFLVHSEEADDLEGGEKQTFGRLLDDLADGTARTWFVEGAAGSGKSTLITHVATELLDREIACLFINPNSLRAADEPILNDLKRWALEFRPADVDKKIWNSRIKHQKCVFLIDAVNELEREFRSDSRWRFVRHVLERGHKFAVLATGRSEPDGFGAMLQRPIERLSIAPLTPEQIVGYLTSRGVDSAEVLAEIRVSGLDGSTWNPFFLSLLADLFESRRSHGTSLGAPRSRAELLLATVNRGRLRLTDDEQRLTRKGLNLEAALCAAAVAVFLTEMGAGRKDSGNLRLHDIEVLLGKVWPDAQAVEAMAAAFLHTQMVERLSGPDTDDGFRLLHPSLVDFGLALGWRKREPPGLVSSRYHALDQCFADWIGLQPEPDAAARKWLSSPLAANGFDLLVDTVLANQGLLSEATQNDYWQSIGQGLLADSPWVDNLARSLGNLPRHVCTEAVNRGLLRALRRRKAALADEVALALREGTLNQHSLGRLYRRHGLRFGSGASAARNMVLQPEAGPMPMLDGVPGNLPERKRSPAAPPTVQAAAGIMALAESVADSTKPVESRIAAAAALGELQGRAAIEHLILTTQEAGAPTELRVAAVAALGPAEDPAAIAVLSRIVAAPAEPAELRIATAKALGKAQQSAAIETLTNAMHDANTPTKLRVAAAMTLGKAQHSAAITALIKAMEEPGAPSELRVAAAAALASAEDPVAIAALKRAVSQPGTPVDLRIAAAATLGKARHSAAIETLVGTVREMTEPTELRVGAAAALGAIGNSVAVEPLVAVLTNVAVDMSVRAAAASALGHIGDRTGINPLMATISDRTCPSEVRRAVITALGRIGATSAIDFLMLFLDEQPDADIRGAAITALGRLGAQSAGERLIGVMYADIDVLNRAAAATALGRIRYRPAVAPLVAVLNDVDAAANVRGSAAAALGQLGDRAAVEPLTAVLGDGGAPADARWSAAAALGQLGDRAAVEPLTAILRNTDASTGARASAARVLGTLGARSAVSSLAAVLGDADTPVTIRSAAATALGQLGDCTAVESLAATLGDTSAPAYARGAAATALRQLGDRAAVEPLVTALTDPTLASPSRGAAATALGHIRDRAAVGPLAAVLGDTEAAADLRGAAATALGRIGDRTAVAPLSAALRDITASAAVRGSATTALGQLGDRAAVEPLTAALRDTTAPSQVRGAAAMALGQLGDRAAVEPLAAALGDSTTMSNVRGAAATALSQIGDLAAVEPLTVVLRDTTAPADARGSAATALGLLGDRAAVEPLAAALGDTTASADIRGSAATALGLLGDRAAVEPLSIAVTEHTLEPPSRGAAATALGRIGDRTATGPLAAVLRDTAASAELRGAAATALGRIGDRTAVEALVSAVHDITAPAGIRGSVIAALGKIGDDSAITSLRNIVEDARNPTRIRVSAVNALALLPVDSHDWLIPIAEGREPHRPKVNRILPPLRAAIVRLISNRVAGDREATWLDGLARHDPSPANRANAVRALSQAGLITDDLIRNAAGSAEQDGDRDVRANVDVLREVAAAIVRMAEHDERRFADLLPLLGALPAIQHPPVSLWQVALAPVTTFPIPVAQRALDSLGTVLNTVAGTSALTQLAAHREELDERMRVAAEFESLRRIPEEPLIMFHQEANSPFDSGDTPAPEAQPHGCDIAFLTAIDVETVAMLDALQELGIQTQTTPRRGRYYSRFVLPTGTSPVPAVLIQATDKGGQAASALVHDTIVSFNPSLILLVGVAGGFAERGVRLYDVIVARNVFNYDPARIERSGHNIRTQPYRTDEQMYRLARHLNTHGELAELLDGSSMHFKDFASGEKVIAWEDDQLRRDILNLSIDIFGVETEGHGVLHAIWESFKADSFVGGAIIKCVSDLGDEDMRIDKETKQRLAASRASRLAIRIAAQFHRFDA